MHLVIVFLSSSVEKKTYINTGLNKISFKMLELICWFCTELKDWWSACYKLLSSIHSCLLYYKASIARSFCFLTQFMSSQGLLFFDAISLILSSKNKYFVFLTVLLNIFQLSNILYFASLTWQSSFHQALECLVILTYFKCLYQMISDLFANSWTASLRDSLFISHSVLIFLMAFISLVMNLSFSLLFLIIVYHLSRTNFLMMEYQLSMEHDPMNIEV